MESSKYESWRGLTKSNGLRNESWWRRDVCKACEDYQLGQYFDDTIQ